MKAKVKSRPAHPESPGDGFYKRLMDNLYDGVYFVDRERAISYWNKGAERLTGYSAREVVGRRCADNLLVHVDAAGQMLCHGDCPLALTMADGQPREAEVYCRHRDGHRVPITVRASPLHDSSGHIVGAVEVFSDPPAMQRAMERVRELEKQALVDALTGIGNRRYLDQKLASSMDEFQRYGHSFGLLMIDIDLFKQVNDRYGHDNGDAVLRTAARSLLSGLRLSDLLGRWGGEEFLAVLPAVTSPAELSEIAERCRLLVQESASPAGHHRIRVTASLGATIVRPGDTCASLLARADHLLYCSKAEGRNRATLG